MTTANSDTLQDLYQNHSGYASDKWDIYLSEYQRLFSPLRGSLVELLEIGIQNGGSLEIWRQYFYNAKIIVGCDINPNCSQLSYPDGAIKLVIGDINSAGALSEILSYSDQYHIIIDDGSHTSRDIIESFCRLFPHVAEGGQYIIEDLHCSYWKQFQGGLFYPESSMAFFKAITDILNFEHWGVELTREYILQSFGSFTKLSEDVLAQIHSVEFINSMCIIKKMRSDKNLLGVRRISGENELVSPIRHVAGSLSKTPPQSYIEVGQLVGTAENERLETLILLEAKDRLIADQNEKITLLEERCRRLENSTVEKDGNE